MTDHAGAAIELRQTATAPAPPPGSGWDFELGAPDSGTPERSGTDQHWDVVLVSQGNEATVGGISAAVSERCLRVTRLGLSPAAIGVYADVLVIGRLRELAAAHGCTHLEFMYRRTGKADEAAEFLRRLGGVRRPRADGLSLILPLADAMLEIADFSGPDGTADMPIDVPALIGARWHQLGARRRGELNLIAAQDWPVPGRLTTAVLDGVHARAADGTDLRLAEVWRYVLGQDVVGQEANFFELGGHSLLASRLIAQVNQLFGVTLDLGAVFDHPTLASLAAEVRRAVAVAAPRKDPGAARPPLVAATRPEHVPLSYAQWRLWFIQQMEGPSATYNIPIAVRLTGELDAGALRSALTDVVGRHESLRTVFPDVDGVPYQRVLSDAQPVFEEMTVRREDLAEVLTAAAEYRIDVTAELPVRAWLCQLGREEHVLLLLLHHICGDAWSMRPLSHDLAYAYQSRLNGSAPNWEPLPVQYADYALWQRELLGERNDPRSLAARQIEFWRSALAGLPEELALPFDWPRPAAASFRGGIVSFAVPAGTHAALTELARECGTTLFTVMQAAVAVLLSRLGAGMDIPIGTPAAARSEPALDGVIGFFVNMLILRTDLSGDPSFRMIVGRAREMNLAAFAHQDVPFERLVEALNPARSMARHPLFQVALTVASGARDSFPRLPGLACTLEEIEQSTAKFDLYFALFERQTKAGDPAGMDGELEYPADLFARETADSLAAQFVRTLEAVVSQPDSHIGQIETAPK